MKKFMLFHSTCKFRLDNSLDTHKSRTNFQKNNFNASQHHPKKYPILNSIIRFDFIPPNLVHNINSSKKHHTTSYGLLNVNPCISFLTKINLWVTICPFFPKYFLAKKTVNKYISTITITLTYSNTMYI